MYNKKNLIIYVSSRINYDMLDGEVLRNINSDGFEIINIDDKSSSDEIKKGKRICDENNILFLDNKSRGVQWATQTLIDYVSENRPECKWIFCFQHDCYPITEDFFNRFSKLDETGLIDNFGTVGFNRLDMGKSTPKAYDKWKSGEKPMGHIGLAHLSVLNTFTRNIQPDRHSWLNEKDEWKVPHCLEIICWTAFAINVNLWKKYVKPTDEYHFHLWAPDVSMQFLSNNIYNLVLPNLYLMNKQELKKKYGINPNSAHDSKDGNEYHFGHYHPSHEAWQKRWGWKYDDPTTIPNVKEKWKGTLIEEFINHNIKNGPLKQFDLGDY